MLLRHSLELPKEAAAVEKAVHEAIANGVRTADIAAGGKAATSTQAGDAVIAKILQ
jgi:3-isopropylmalate dehydrogenase